MDIHIHPIGRLVEHTGQKARETAEYAGRKTRETVDQVHCVYMLKYIYIRVCLWYLCLDNYNVNRRFVLLQYVYVWF